MTLETGATVLVVGQPQKSGLVDVSYEGEIIAMFLRDLQDRAELIGVDVPFTTDGHGDDTIR